MSSYTGVSGSRSRSSPAIGPNQIVVGDNWAHDRGKTTTPGAVVMSVSKSTGALLWKTTVDSTSQWSDILGSPIIYGDTVFMGVTSWEEALSVDQVAYVPSFRHGCWERRQHARCLAPNKLAYIRHRQQLHGAHQCRAVHPEGERQCL